MYPLIRMMYPYVYILSNHHITCCYSYDYLLPFGGFHKWGYTKIGMLQKTPKMPWACRKNPWIRWGVPLFWGDLHFPSMVCSSPCSQLRCCDPGSSGGRSAASICSRALPTASWLPRFLPVATHDLRWSLLHIDYETLVFLLWAMGEVPLLDDLPPENGRVCQTLCSRRLKCYISCPSLVDFKVPAKQCKIDLFAQLEPKWIGCLVCYTSVASDATAPKVVRSRTTPRGQKWGANLCWRVNVISPALIT